MNYTFIVNPKAGNGRVTKVLQLLKLEISTRRLDTEILFSEEPGHATRLAATATGDVIVAVGGDGTINEVANGIIGSSKVLGIIPSGSGNDLIKSLGIPADFHGAFSKFLGGKSILMDCATVQCGVPNQTAEPGRYFLNGVGIGFDATVAERSSRVRYITGTTRYVVAVLLTLGMYKSPTFKIALDSGSKVSKNLLIAIGNGRCAGGGFYLTPDAKIDDGYLDVCMIEEISIPQILAIMPKVMKGKHVSEKEVTMDRAKIITVEAPEPFNVHADGEIIGRDVNAVRISIVEKGLNVIADGLWNQS